MWCDVCECVREARYYSISCDEKDGRLICLVAFTNKDMMKETRPIAYGELSGHDAEDLAKFITAALEAAGLRREGLVSFRADGASVNGARRALSAGGDNVLRRLEQWAGRKLLAVHCAAHRLQLFCSDALSGGDQYLLDLEARVKALHRHLKASPGATVDMGFWADLCDEEVLTTAGTSTSRWLSLLLPLRKLLQSYVSVLAHLAYVFKHHKKDRESAKVHQWIYLGLASWAARITVAALVDVLGLAYHAKNQLENVTSIERVAEIAQQLRASLASYTEKNSALANAMVGGNAVAKTYEAEKVCRLWREQQNSKILVRYETKDGDIVEEGIRFAGFEDVQHILRTFQRVTCSWKFFSKIS